MIVAGFLMLLVIAPLAVFWGDSRVVAGLACLVAALALWRAAMLQERERLRGSRPNSAADVVRQLSAWVTQRRRDPIVSKTALDRGQEYATGVQDGAYATLDEVLDRLAELLRMLPGVESTRRGRRSGRARPSGRPAAGSTRRSGSSTRVTPPAGARRTAPAGSVEGRPRPPAPRGGAGRGTPPRGAAPLGPRGEAGRPRSGGSPGPADPRSDPRSGPPRDRQPPAGKRPSGPPPAGATEPPAPRPAPESGRGGEAPGEPPQGSVLAAPTRSRPAGPASQRPPAARRPLDPDIVASPTS
ncbi:MAG: hypothetical protein HY241_17450 [Actinobacteria bacterium]|nr:hypothetical protein [Actinomycetota bacterium]